jgi:hypothetical protein
MATPETEICLLSFQEATGWTFYSKPPSRCDKGIHKHVSQSEARKVQSDAATGSCGKTPT